MSADATAALDRLLSQPALGRAPRVRALLEFLIQELAGGRAEQVNEQRIAESVFHRPAGFSSGEDNIVRVTVAHLRTRLQNYYEGAGRNESWALEIPKGKYVPVLRWREPEAFAVVAPVEVPRRARSSRNLLYGALVLLVISNILTGYRSLTRGVDEPKPKGFLAAAFANQTTPVTLVVTDHNLWADRYIFGDSIKLSDYVARASRSSPSSAGDGSEVSGRAREFTRFRTSTSVTSAAVAASLQFALLPQRLRVRHPSEIRTLDLQNDSAILLGSPLVDPWTQLFEDRLNFRIAARPDSTGFEIQNTHPASNEPPVFTTHMDRGVRVTYVRVAYLPNLSGNGHIVLIGGNTGDPPQEGGTNFLAAPESFGEILRRFSAASISRVPPFELVLEVKAVERSSVGTRIVAQRRHDDWQR